MELHFSKGMLGVSMLMVLLSYIYYYYDLSATKSLVSSVDYSKENHIINAWTKIIKAPSLQFKRIAIGINTNIDVIVSGTDLLNELGVKPGKGNDLSTIDNIGQLQEAFSHFFSMGNAAERPFTNKEDYNEIIKAAERLDRVEHYIGGNAALMAKTAAKMFPDLTIQLVGPVGPLLESLLPKRIQVPSACKILTDEIHLIMEYKVGETWGNNKASVATRFITSYDESNSQSLMLEPFFESLKTFKPDVIVLSGLNLLDGQKPEFFQKRLSKLVLLSSEVSESIPMHLELASMANTDFVKEIIEKVVPNIHSLGLNEQELLFASISSGGPHKDQMEGPTGQPFIHKVSDILLWLLDKFGQSSLPSSRLSRVHFHSLTYHITAVVKGTWSNVDEATAAGALTAGRQACDVQNLNSDIVSLKIPPRFRLFSGGQDLDFDPENPVIQWTQDGYEFVFSPVLVCKHPVKTVGLGDAISSTGLMYSEFNYQS